jgi:hypothetical protein
VRAIHRQACNCLTLRQCGILYVYVHVTLSVHAFA